MCGKGSTHNSIDKNIIRHILHIDARCLDLNIQIFSRGDSVYLPYPVKKPSTKSPSLTHSMKVEIIELANALQVSYQPSKCLFWLGGRV